MSTAFLVVYVDTRTLKLVEASIHSEDALSLTMVGGSLRPLNVYKHFGTSFEDARAQLLAYVRNERYFAWLQPLLEHEQ